MRRLPLLAVSTLVVAVLVASDPEAVGLSCAPLGAALDETQVPAAEFIGPCRDARVIDGDTLDLTCAGERQRVRLLRVDTPERDEPGYAEASRALRRLVRQGDLRLLLETPGEPVRDRHGRLLAYLYAGDRNLNVELVRLGWSPFDRRFGPGRFAHPLTTAEQEARTETRGLWKSPND